MGGFFFLWITLLATIPTIAYYVCMNKKDEKKMIKEAARILGMTKTKKKSKQSIINGRKHKKHD